MHRLSILMDYVLWPALMVGACCGMAYGTALGHGTWGFNITYLSLAATIALLERLRPHEREWLKSDGQEVPDMAHTLFTKVSVQILIVSLANFGIVHQFGSRESSGIWPGHWPLFCQVILGLVTAEFGLYWAHRLAHEWGPLWRFHAVHHSVKRLWFWNTGRFHFMDTLKSMIFSAPILVVSGAPGEVILWGSAITAFVGILTHCNVRMKFGWLNYLFNTPGLHRWHHSKDVREGNKNYGENLMLWDLIFGTFYDDATRPHPDELGMKHAMPKSFFGQLAMPLFYWRRYQDEALQRAEEQPRA
ncbi:MAG: sterol desaturase family protein [Roseimicrobium sp.]